MAKQTINLGTSANKGDGDPLRTAFDKVNDNFDEVYSLLGAEGGDTDDVVAPMLVHNDHTNITVTRDDDANKIIFSVDQAVTDLKGSVFGDDSTVLVDGVNGSINLDGTVKGDIVPDTDVAYDLGSASKRFRDLYLSGSTIDLGGTTLSIVGGELQLGGVKVPTQTDLDSAVGVVDGLVAGEGIPALLTAYTDQSAVVDALLNAGDYGGDLVAPSNYTFYDLVVARRAANPLIPQELEDEALAQLNAYNAWQAEIAADKATITVGDYAWNFKGDGDLTIAGNIEIDGSFINNSVSDGTGLQVETTSDFEIKVDTAIWSFEPNDGGRIQFPDGSTQTTAYPGPQTLFDGDVTGSVFSDDSTLLVDGVAGKIVGPVDTASITQSDTGNFTSNFTTTITQDNQYTKFTKVDVFDDGEFVDTINREIKLGSNSLLFDSTVGASAVIRNDGVSGSLVLEAGTGNADEGDADGGDIVITSGYSGVGGNGGNIILNSNADIFVGPLANTLDIRIGGGPGYAGENNTFFYGNVNIDSGKKLDTESVTNSSGNLTLTADNYVIIDSDNNGQINIGVESGIGNVLLGNIDNGTDVIVNGRLFHGGGIAPASSIGADGDFKGEVVFDNSYIYYCTANYDGVTNIWKRVAWSGDTW